MPKEVGRSPRRVGRVSSALGPGPDAQEAVPRLPDRDEVMPVGVADGLRGREQGVVLVVAGVDATG